MARSEGVPVIKLHVDKEQVCYGKSMAPYLKALFEAMKTKPKAVERTITYYPEAVELKGRIEWREGEVTGFGPLGEERDRKRVFVRED